MRIRVLKKDAEGVLQYFRTMMIERDGSGDRFEEVVASAAMRPDDVLYADDYYMRLDAVHPHTWSTLLLPEGKAKALYRKIVEGERAAMAAGATW